jgi:hypoxanthine phosphoribosyltransferase
MSIVKIKDKTFETSITEAQIKQRVKELAQQISKDMEGKNPLLIGVLNGSFIFAADLLREMTIPCEISFVKLAS